MKLIVAFLNFANAPKNGQILTYQQTYIFVCTAIGTLTLAFKISFVAVSFHL
jgi:hypothetical protein